MKVNANKIHVILGLAILTQVGCNSGQRQRAQYLNPNIAAMQAQDLTTTGDNFRTGTGQGGGWGPAASQLTNFLNNQPPVNRPGTVPGTVPGTTERGTARDSTTNTTAQVSDPVTFKVNMDSDPLWITYCKELGGDPDTGDDTDGDGITDACETLLSTTADKARRLIALDPKVFNGAAISTKRYYKENAGLVGARKASNSETSILLTEDETKSWKKSKALGGFGSGIDSKFDRQITKKFLALATQEGNDMKGLKKLFAIEQDTVKGKLGKDFQANFEIIDQNQAAERGRDIGYSGVDAKYGLVRADNIETIPFSLSEDGSAVSDLSGVASTVNSLRQDEEFIYIAETHIVVPTGGMELRVGNLMSDRKQALAGSKAGMFFVIAGNNSVVVTSDLIANDNNGGEDLKKSRGSIPTPNRCKTAHVVIAFFADSQKTAAMMDRSAIFAENVFYKDKASEEWKLIPQEWMRLKSMDKSANQKCETKSDDILFKDLASQLSENTAEPLVVN